MELKLRFGPAGSDETYKGKTADIPQYLAGFELNAFEVQCGRGVQMGKDAALTLKQNANEHGITLSVHTPYFISLTNPERLEGNTRYLRQSAELAGWLGARRLVVHTGAVMGMSRKDALEQAKLSLSAILDTARDEGWHETLFCLETMGKINQLGTADEVFALCEQDERLLPCIDFGHLYARSHGTMDGEEACRQVLDEMERVLGAERAKECHIHFSHIAYNNGGESKHLTFSDEGGPEWEPLAHLLVERGYRSTVICESRGTQTADAQMLKTTAERLNR